MRVYNHIDRKGVKIKYWIACLLPNCQISARKLNLSMAVERFGFNNKDPLQPI